MDYKFPRQLYPGYFNSGPPCSQFRHNVGGWGSYGQVCEVNATLHEKRPTLPSTHWKFETQHQVKGEPWLPVEPIAVPLLQPKQAFKWSSTTLSDPMDFSEHMQNFYQYNSQDAFCTMSHVLGEHFYFKHGRRKGSYKNAAHMSRTKGFMETLKYKKCELTHLSQRTTTYNNLLSDVIHDIPPELLGDLLHEELTHQRELEQFSEKATGGALGYIPFTQSSESQQGCLLYPGKAGLFSLNFHRVVLEFQDEKPPRFDMSSKPFSYQLNGTIRQISTGLQQNESHVAVRSDHLCGVWKVSETLKPQILEVIQIKRPTTCLSVSPHIHGELLVASESGAAYLWTVGKGLHKFRKEDGNLYFNVKSSWRWCDFSGHPRVMAYVDRTGVELSDIRTSNTCDHTLFRIGQSPNCKSGERVIMSKYLREVHTFQHLITTQHSAYIMDERFPCIPMIKWDHMMVDPPMFAQVLASSSEGGTAKVLLGSQRSQELSLLQYSGGKEHACCSRGPPQTLLSPRDSLRHLPVQLPHLQHTSQERLGVPAAGLTAIQHSQGEECICVLQLTEAGDIFYHMLRPQPEQSSEDPPEPTQNSEEAEGRDVTEQRPSSERPSNDTFVNPNRARKRTLSFLSTGSTDDSGFEGRVTPRFELEVVVNDEPEPVSDMGLNKSQDTSVIPPSIFQSDGVNARHAARPVPVKVSDETLLKWRKWLLELVEKEPFLSNTQHWTTKTKGLLPCDRPPTERFIEEDQRQSLRTELRGIMSRGDLLVHGGTFLRPLELVSVPDTVEPSYWADDLSQRMSVSWEGGWKAWWEEKLGMNREEKVAALRMKRRRQKQARAQHRMDLSGSFTSSVSYQSDLDNLSGWSSAASQCASPDRDSDGFSFFTQEEVLSEPEASAPQKSYPGSSQPTTPQRQQLSQPNTPQTQQPISSQPNTPQRQQPRSSQPNTPQRQQPRSSQPNTPQRQQPRSSQPNTPQRQQPISSQLNTPQWQQPSSSQLNRVEVDSTPASILKTLAERKPKQTDQDYLSSLFGSQEPSQGGFNESSYSTPLATSSQMSSISTSQRTFRVGPLSQGSQSQPKRKKSRMGF